MTSNERDKNDVIAMLEEGLFGGDEEFSAVPPPQYSLHDDDSTSLQHDYHILTPLSQPPTQPSPVIAKEEEAGFTFGEKLEYFYLCLVEKQAKDFPDHQLTRHMIFQQELEITTPSDDIYFNREICYLTEALSILEQHAREEAKEGSQDVCDEVVKDCRKKASSLLRIPYIEQINTLITICRKRLHTKIAVGSSEIEAGSVPHGQRYVYIMIDLLGSFSNMLLSFQTYSFSQETYHAIFATLYQRMIDMTKDCYQCYLQDKDVNQWIAKTSSIERHDEIHLQSLDTIIAQLAMMKHILIQHYTFLFNTSTTLFYHDSQAVVVFEDRLMFASKDELNVWKELTFIYLSLECAYLLHTTVDIALTSCQLLEQEEHVYCLQAIEDFIFIVMKCLERCRLLGEDTSFLSLGNKVLELIQCSHQEQLDDVLLHQLMTSSRLYRGCVAQKEMKKDAVVDLVRRCTGWQADSKLPKVLFDTPSKSQKPGDEQGGNIVREDGDAGGSSALIDAGDQSAKMVLEAVEGWSTLFTEVTTSTVNNVVQNWFSSNWVLGDDAGEISIPTSGEAYHTPSGKQAVEEPSRPTINRSAAASNQPQLLAASVNATTTPYKAARSVDAYDTPIADKSGSHSMTVGSSSKGTSPAGGAAVNRASSSSPLPDQSATASTVEELLLRALAGDQQDDYDYEYDYEDGQMLLSSEDSTLSTIKYCYVRSSSGLKEPDWVVQLNSVTCLLQAIQTIMAFFDTVDECLFPQSLLTSGITPPPSSNGSNNSRLHTLVTEFHSCYRYYDQWLQHECKSMIAIKLQHPRLVHVASLSQFVYRSYQISGQEMEDTMNTHLLRVIINQLLQHSPLTTNIDGSEDSNKANTANPKKRTLSLFSMKTHQFYLHCIASYVAEVLYEECIKKQVFNEWGALLLYDEVQEMIQFLDHQMTAITILPSIGSSNSQGGSSGSGSNNVDTFLESTSVLSGNLAMRRLQCACKILTLDAPADIRRYHFLLTSNILFPNGEDDIRMILSKRKEFSKEAVQKVKLQL